MSFNLSFIFLIIIGCQISSLRAVIYQVPPMGSQEDEDIRLDEIYVLEEPKLGLEKVYMREVYEKVSNKSLVRFDACTQSAPQISFSYLGYSPLQRHKKSTNSSNMKQKQAYPLIYDYEQLKSKYTNIIDMVFYDHHVFTISSLGVIRIYRIDQGAYTGIEERGAIYAIDWDRLKSQHIQQHKEWIQHMNIGKGYFQFMNSNRLLLFANGRFLICFDIRTFKVTVLSQQLAKPQQQNQQKQNQQNQQKQNNKNNNTNNNRNDTNNKSSGDKKGFSSNKIYTLLQDFQSVTKIDESHFAVLDRKQGAIVYKIQKEQSKANDETIKTEDEYTIKIVDIIDKDRFHGLYSEEQSMNLMDIKYNSQKDYLLLLDYEKGILTLNRQKITLLNQTTQKQKFIFNPNVILKKQCNLMQISSKTQMLYIVCNKFYRISLQKWPIIEEKVYPHPMISIKEIFIQQDQYIVVLAGYEVFKVIYLDRPAAYFHDDMLDKIVFDRDLVITANQYHIVAYNFLLQKPQIVCSTNNQSLIGLHNLILKTTAECHSSFLSQLNNKHSQISKFQEDDICIYTVYKNVRVWQQGKLPVEELVIFFIVIGIFGVLMIVWYLATMWRAKRAMAYLINLGGDTSKLVVQTVQRSDKYQETNEQIKSQNIQTDVKINKEKEFQMEQRGQFNQ